METPKGTVRVQREGGRGHHLIDETNYDPKVHVPCDEDGKPIGKEVAPKGPKELADMTNAELANIARDEGIDLGDATKKADMIAAIELGRESAAHETAANGLTRREINADLEAMDIEFDPNMPIEELAALRDKAKAERSE